MFNRQLKEIVAMAMIGEGIVGLLAPRRYVLLWKFGPRAYRELIDAFARHPAAARLLFAAEAGLGLWWALRQLPAEASAGERPAASRGVFHEPMPALSVRS